MFFRRRVNQYPGGVKRALSANDVLPQFVVRKLVGFRSDDQVWLLIVLEPLVKLQVLFRGFVTRIDEVN